MVSTRANTRAEQTPLPQTKTSMRTQSAVIAFIITSMVSVTVIAQHPSSRTVKDWADALSSNLRSLISDIGGDLLDHHLLTTPQQQTLVDPAAFADEIAQRLELKFSSRGQCARLCCLLSAVSHLDFNFASVSVSAVASSCSSTYHHRGDVFDCQWHPPRRDSGTPRVLHTDTG